jgi:hypothetical protein
VIIRKEIECTLQEKMGGSKTMAAIIGIHFDAIINHEEDLK